MERRIDPESEGQSPRVAACVNGKRSTAERDPSAGPLEGRTVLSQLPDISLFQTELKRRETGRR